MEGRKFLDVAQELAQGGTEAHWRSAAGRAYYALMLEGRALLGRWGFVPPPRDQVHMFVRLHFLYAPDRDLKKVGHSLEELGKLRNQAEYQMNSAAVFINAVAARDALQKARDNLARMDQVDSDPTRKALVITGIRAAFP